MRNVLILCASVVISASACAEATSSSSPTTATTPASSSTIATPNVPSDAPYIVLSANHDEPNGYGFCMDTYGPGQTDLMQTHSCKPAKADAARDYAGHDTRFEYNPDTQQIMSYPFEGYCMQALIASDVTVFALLECSDHPRQKFTYSAEDATLSLTEDQSRCVTVASETVPAGPWVKRPLQLESCDDIDASLKQWTIATE